MKLAVELNARLICEMPYGDVCAALCEFSSYLSRRPQRASVTVCDIYCL